MSSRMNFFDPLLSFVFPRVLSLALTEQYLDINKLRRDRGLSPYRNHHDVFADAFIMVNSNFGMEYATAIGPLVRMTGPLLPIQPQGRSFKTDQWLNELNKPVVLVLTGTGSMASYEDWQLKALAQGLHTTTFRVLWALRKKDREFLGIFFPSHLRVKRNFVIWPLLAHPLVQLVVSPCGAATAQEALVAGKPLLCIPTIADQIDVSSRIQDQGCGLQLLKDRIDASFVTKAIVTLYRNQSFAQCAKRMSKILTSPGGTTAAADFVEYTMTPSAQNLRIQHRLSRLKELNLDILMFLIVVVLSLLLVIRSTVILFKLLLRKKTHRPEDGTKEKEAPKAVLGEGNMHSPTKQRRRMREGVGAKAKVTAALSGGLG